MTTLALLNYLGAATSAMRASLTVTSRGLDIVAAVFLATIAGLGGGTVRDLLISLPVFWTHDQGYFLACAVPAALVWISGRGTRLSHAIDIADAIGIGAYAVSGCLKAEQAGCSPLAAVAVGAAAATWGGLLREVLAGEPTVLVRKEVYITAALFACLTFIAGRTLGLPAEFAALAGAAAGTGLRLLAMWRAFEMPAPPRGRRE